MCLVPFEGYENQGGIPLKEPKATQSEAYETRNRKRRQKKWRTVR
jgi:hypothetical protein